MKLLVAAMQSELDAFPEEIPGFDQLVTGPGKIKATYQLTKMLATKTYDEVVVVGTAGGVDRSLAVDAHEISAAIQHDVQDLDGTLGVHVSLPVRVETGRNGVVISTGDSFTDDLEVAARIRSYGAGLVDMETYAYIWVAQQFAVPIRAFRAVSDGAEEGAVADFEVAIARCSEQLWARIQAEYGV